MAKRFYRVVRQHAIGPFAMSTGVSELFAPGNRGDRAWPAAGDSVRRRRAARRHGRVQDRPRDRLQPHLRAPGRQALVPRRHPGPRRQRSRRPAQSLKKLVGELKPTHVVAIGASAGGYGALVLGCLIGADRILAFGAESHLMLPGSRSKQDMKAQAAEQVRRSDAAPAGPQARQRVAGRRRCRHRRAALRGTGLAAAVRARRGRPQRRPFQFPRRRRRRHFQELFLAAIGAVAVDARRSAVASDMLNDRLAIAEAFEAHAALLAKQYDGGLAPCRRRARAAPGLGARPPSAWPRPRPACTAHRRRGGAGARA